MHSRTEPPQPQLTHREVQVLYLVVDGLSAKEIAQRLKIAPCTVERHVENVRLKTRTRNRAHMIAIVFRQGLLGAGAGELSPSGFEDAEPSSLQGATPEAA